jgi:hypothetical protein
MNAPRMASISAFGGARYRENYLQAMRADPGVSNTYQGWPKLLAACGRLLLASPRLA